MATKKRPTAKARKLKQTDLGLDEKREDEAAIETDRKPVEAQNGEDFHLSEKTVENLTDHKTCPRVVVYAIAKNEAKFAARWMDSMGEADGIAVVDTGSTDGTAETLEKLGAKVKKEEFVPWRFDTARNASIAWALKCFRDATILVCTDLDEILLPGWRDALVSAWTDYVKEHGRPPTTGEYEYVWNFNPDGTDGTKFMYHKVHAANCGAVWKHPVHEILDYGHAEKHVVKIHGMRLEHHADPTKSRAQYLDLLKASVEECPDDDRNMHYYGRELMFRGRWEEAIEVLKRHLGMKRATWKAERAASMRFIAKCCLSLGRANEAYAWWKEAMKEAPNQREAAVELQWAAYTFRMPNGNPMPDWPTVVEAGRFATAITVRDMNYTTKAEAWGSRPWDLLALGLWYTGRKDEAREAIKKAIELSPNDDRLHGNAKLMGVEK